MELSHLKGFKGHHKDGLAPLQWDCICLFRGWADLPGWGVGVWWTVSDRERDPGHRLLTSLDTSGFEATPLNCT